MKEHIRPYIVVAGYLDYYFDQGAAKNHIWFSARIGRRFCDHILKLAVAVRSLKVFSVTEPDESCEVLDGPAGPVESYELVTGNWQHGGDPANIQRCDIMKLAVIENSFYWTWMPTHAGGSALCTTPTISIRDMEKAFRSTQRRKRSLHCVHPIED